MSEMQEFLDTAAPSAGFDKPIAIESASGEGFLVVAATNVGLYNVDRIMVGVKQGFGLPAASVGLDRDAARALRDALTSLLDEKDSPAPRTGRQRLSAPDL